MCLKEKAFLFLHIPLQHCCSHHPCSYISVRMNFTGERENKDSPWSKMGCLLWNPFRCDEEIQLKWPEHAASAEMYDRENDISSSLQAAVSQLSLWDPQRANTTLPSASQTPQNVTSHTSYKALSTHNCTSEQKTLKHTLFPMCILPLFFLGHKVALQIDFNHTKLPVPFK